MINWLHKKFVPLAVAIIFSVAGFGAFVNVASADIISDLSDILPLDAKYLPSAGRVAEIPSDLTPSQSQAILTNIKNDGLVQTSFKRILAAEITEGIAQSNYDRNLLCSPATISTPAICPEGAALLTSRDELDSAISELESALVLARDRQDLIIESYRAQNAVTEALTTGTTRITDTAQTRQTTFAEQGQTDIANQTPVEFTPEYINSARQAKQNASAWNTDDTIALKMQEACSFGLGGVNFMPCVAQFVYKIIYKPTAYALMGAGYIFDEILTLSIEGAMVAPPFIDSTWKVVRDFSNMIFIFILLYAGVETILGGKNWMNTIRLVIIIALLINFSLFFTKVVIDAGNVLAVGVKSAISTTSVSEGLAAAFQPQQFLSAATKGPDTSGGDAIIVFLVAAVVSGFAAYIFFKAALLFMGRLIAFWGLMIISPFAFISMAMPKGNIFNKWLDTLISQAFVAPVFLFFVYIIMKVISGGTGILSGLPQTGDWFKDLLGPVIVAALLIIALQKALAIATNMSDDFGRGTSNLISKPLGLAGTVALGAATGGTSLLARSTIGRAAQGFTESGALTRLATGDNAFGRFAGRQAITLADKARTGTWDVTGTKIGKATIGKGAAAFGVKLEGPGEGAKGGFKGAMERQSKHDLEVAKKLKMTDEEKGKIEGYTKEKVDLAKASLEEKQKTEREAKAAAGETEKTGGIAHLANAEKLLKATRERERAEEEAKNAKKEADAAAKKIADENARRRGVYAQDARSKVRTGMMWATGNLAYSHAEAKRSADKLRSKTVAEEEGEEKKKKDTAESLKKLLEETKEKESGKEGGKEEKPEKKE